MLDFAHISIDPKKPTQAWKKLKHSCTKNSGLFGHHHNIKVVCISDTHCQHRNLRLSGGDLLLHTGDCTRGGDIDQLKDFLDWFSVQPFLYKVWIAGNHDVTLHKSFYEKNWRRFNRNRERQDHEEVCALIASYSDIIYLEDRLVTVDGIKIYGSPWQPTFFQWAFNAERGHDIEEKWLSIPEGIDILMTHGPPLGYGDWCISGKNAGCAHLLHQVMYRIKPCIHVFGHIHEDSGMWNNGAINFVNAASCSPQYQLAHPPKEFWL